jgi:outer membrane biosynthesis protein TonB
MKYKIIILSGILSLALIGIVTYGNKQFAERKQNLVKLKDGLSAVAKVNKAENMKQTEEAAVKEATVQGVSEESVKPVEQPKAVEKVINVAPKTNTKKTVKKTTNATNTTNTTNTTTNNTEKTNTQNNETINNGTTTDPDSNPGTPSSGTGAENNQTTEPPSTNEQPGDTAEDNTGDTTGDTGEDTSNGGDATPPVTNTP